MKIEIDLDQVMGSQEEVRDSVISEIAEYFKNAMVSEAREEVDKIIKETASQEMKKQIENVIKDALDFTYQITDRYGDIKGETTIRKTIVKIVQEECVYNPRNSSYDQNAFTKAICGETEKQLNVFRKDFNRLIDEQFITDCQNHAMNKLRERLNIK